MDVTIDQIIAAVQTSDPVLAGILGQLPALPADLSVCELAIRLIDGARKAAATYNTGKPVGERISAYAVSPGAIATAADGSRAATVTGTVTVLASVDLMTAIAARN